MFPLQLFLLLSLDSLSGPLDRWVPQRMATLHVAALGVSVLSAGKPPTRWTHGVENVLTRTAASPATIWPLRELGTAQSHVASPHARVAVILAPGLIVLGVMSTLSWLLLTLVSTLTRRHWRFGRWHEVMSVVLGAPLAWLYLRHAAGPMLATWFTAIAGTLLVVASALAAVAWRKSRLSALVVLAAVVLLVSLARNLVLPLPAKLDGAGAAGATLGQLETLVITGLAGDSTVRAGLGFEPKSDRWVARDRSRGAEASLILLPTRGMGVIVVSNTGASAVLLDEIVDSVAR